MKVKVLNQMAVTTLGFDGAAETIDVPDALATKMMEQGYVEKAAAKKVERATKAPDDEPKSTPRKKAEK